MITDRGIVCRAVADGAGMTGLTAADAMTKNISCARDRDDLEKALKNMSEEKIRRLPVTAKNRRMVGMLAPGDISHAATTGAAGETIAAVGAHD